MKVRPGRWIAALLFPALLLSCATTTFTVGDTLPSSPATSDSLLFIPLRVQKDASFQFFAKYRLRLTGQRRAIVLDPLFPKNIVTGLEAGTYTIESIQPDRRYSSETSSIYPLSISFTLRPGHITVLPVQLNIRLFRRAGFVWQGWQTEELTSARLTELAVAIRLLKNADDWEIEAGDAFAETLVSPEYRYKLSRNER